MIKPFEDRELHATIEMALYKHKMEEKEHHNHLQVLVVEDNILNQKVAIRMLEKIIRKWTIGAFF